MSTVAATLELNRPRLEGLGRVIALHLVPGVPAVLAYALFARILTANGLPNFLGLSLASLSVEVPFVWWLMLRTERKAGRRLSLKGLFPWHARLSWPVYAMGLPFLVFSFLMIGLGTPAAQSALRPALFGWLPDWFVMGWNPAELMTMPRPLVLSAWVLTLFMLGLGGVTQQLYFFGYLLPRMTWLGGWAPVLNAALFAVFHMAAPWGWIVFFLSALPWAYLVRWKRSVWIGMFIQMGVLSLQWVLLTLVIFGVVQLPPA